MKQAKRLAQGVSPRGVNTVLLEYKQAGQLRRDWVMDHFDERQRQAEAEQWRRDEERAWDAEDTYRRLRTKKVIADVGKLYTT